MAFAVKCICKDGQKEWPLFDDSKHGFAEKGKGADGIPKRGVLSVFWHIGQVVPNMFL